jgi:hypothetical protein
MVRKGMVWFFKKLEVVMQKVKVSIKGIAGLIQNRYPIEDNQENKSAKKTLKNFDAQCEKAIYRDEKGKIYQPSTHIEASMISAATEFTRRGKSTYKQTIKSAVMVTPDCIYHNIQKYEKFIVPVVIQRMRVPKARPLFKDWSLDFELNFDEEVISLSTIKEILDAAGQKIGIGDWRPKYGRFIVTKFE